MLRKQMISGWERGLSTSNTLDLFGVLILSQVVSMFSNLGGWLVFCLVPGYLCYQYGGMVIGYCCKGRGGQEGENEEDSKKFLSKR